MPRTLNGNAVFERKENFCPKSNEFTRIERLRTLLLFLFIANVSTTSHTRLHLLNVFYNSEFWKDLQQYTDYMVLLMHLAFYHVLTPYFSLLIQTSGFINQKLEVKCCVERPGIEIRK